MYIRLVEAENQRVFLALERGGFAEKSGILQLVGKAYFICHNYSTLH